jgi:hypothetical protein
MGTQQEITARWEGGKVLPSTRTPTRLAKATGTTYRISSAPPNAVSRQGLRTRRQRSDQDAVR